MPFGPQVAVPGDHERLVHAALVHDAQPIRELDPRELLGIDARLLEVTAERVEGAADVVVDVEDVEAARLGHRVELGPELERGAAQHQRAVALREVAARLLGQRDEVGVGAVVGLRVVGAPDQPVRAELGDEAVDDLARRHRARPPPPAGAT